MKKKSVTLLTLFLLASVIFFYDDIASFIDTVQIYAEGGNRDIFEIHLTAEQVMNQKRGELLKDTSHTYHKSSLKLIPYVLIDAKFIDDKEKSKEGYLLWSEVDGEIVVDTESWQTTRGYRDALLADANAEDYLLLYTLARRNGSATREQLRRDTKLEKELLDKIIAVSAKKNLVVAFNEIIKMHMEEPKILILPASRIKHSLVSREIEYAALIPKEFALRKIKKAARACFGKEFTIRSTKEVYLPIWKIEVKKPDGSISASYWNAVNGLKYTM